MNLNLYSSAIANAEKLANHEFNVVHENHVSIATILKQKKMKMLILAATKFSQLDPNDNERRDITIQSVVDLFDDLAFGSIRRFNPEDFDSIDQSSRHVCEFMLKNILYLLKEKQCACARCGIVIEDTMFGAIGYESDHVEENHRENDQSMKMFHIADAYRKEVYVAINEISKTQLTCGTCHYRVKYSVVEDFPKTFAMKYPAIDPRAVSD
jgi:hypothetical protein